MAGGNGSFARGGNSEQKTIPRLLLYCYCCYDMLCYAILYDATLDYVKTAMTRETQKKHQRNTEEHSKEETQQKHHKVRKTKEEKQNQAKHQKRNKQRKKNKKRGTKEDKTKENKKRREI